MTITRSLPKAKAPAVPSWITAVLGALTGWTERQRQRRALARLDARLLQDIGVAPEDAAEESRKPFWR